MKQNPDCMREVLIQIEEQQGFDANNVLKPLSTSELISSVLREAYDDAEIVYSVKQLAGSGLIEAVEQRQIRSLKYDILDITPQGHEFLQNIRSESVWLATKNRAKQVESFGLEILGKIAATVIVNRIRAMG